MIFETTGGLSGAEIPKTKSLVPRAGKGVVAIAGQHDVGDEVRVPVQSLAGDSVVGVVLVQLPNDQSLV